LDFTIEDSSRPEGGTENRPQVRPNGSTSPASQNSAIRFGLGAIKNLGEGAVQLVLQARSAGGGPFTGIGDFCRRVDLGQVNKRGLECLIKAGTLDDLGERAMLLAMMDRIMKLSALYHQASAVGQLGFEALAPSAADDNALLAGQFFVPPVSQKDILAWEKELLGTYVSEHPLQRLLNAWGGQRNRLYTPLDQVDDALKGHKVIIAGRVVRCRPTMTRKNEEMAFVELEDLSGSLDVVVFPRTFSSAKELLAEDRLVVIEGRVDVREGKVQAIADSVQDLAMTDMNLAAGDGQDFASASDSHPAIGPTPRTAPTAPPVDDGVGEEGGADDQIPAAGNGQSPVANGGHGPNLGLGKPVSPQVRLLEVNLHCTGDHEHDVQVLRTVYRMLERRPGPDRFLFNIISDKGRVQLDFPNVTTRYEPDLDQALRTALGENALYVQWAEA